MRFCCCLFFLKVKMIKFNEKHLFVIFSDTLRIVLFERYKMCLMYCKLFYLPLSECSKFYVKNIICWYYSVRQKLKGKDGSKEN